MVVRQEFRLASSFPNQPTLSKCVLFQAYDLLATFCMVKCICVGNFCSCLSASVRPNRPEEKKFIAAEQQSLAANDFL